MNASTAHRNRVVTLEGYIIEGDAKTPAHPDLIAQCVALWEKKCAGEEIKEELDAIKKDVLEGFDGLSPSAAILIPGVCRISLKKGAAKWTIREVDLVRELLGDRFGDLVDEKTTYVVTPKLTAMIADAADPVGRELKRHVKLVQGDPTVQIVAA